MEILFLGTGTSQGVPMIGCDCRICRSDNPRNKRTRTSVHVVLNGVHVQVDAAPEFREQCIRFGVRQVDLFVLTHGHADHLMGMDDLRRFCDKPDAVGLPVYSSDEGLRKIREVYPYAVRERPVFRGYPAFRLQNLPRVLELESGTISSVMLPHGPVQVLGLLFKERGSEATFAYFTDCKSVSDEAVRLASGSDVVVLDGLRQEVHPSHMTIGEAVEAAAGIDAKRTYLTHMTHTVDHDVVEATLPDSVRLAYDGLRIQI